MLTIPEREAVLTAALPRYAAAGWYVVALSPTGAQIARQRDFDAGAAVLSFLLCGVGLLVYLAVHFSRGPETALLTVDEHGVIHEHAGPR